MPGNAINNPLLPPQLQGLSGKEYFALFLPKVIGIAFLVGALTFFAMLVMGAVSWMGSGGDKANVEMARGRITSALIGIVVLFATFAIIKLIEQFFHVDILLINLGPLTIN